MKLIGIYKIISPTGRIYIGQSIDINYRFLDYRNLRCKSQPRLYNSFKKHGVNNHKFEVIDLCDFHQLNSLERYYQELYTVLGKGGLNCLLSKTDELKSVVSDKTKKKISNSLKGRKICPLIVEKSRQSNIGKKMSRESVLKRVATRKGFRVSAATIELLETNSLTAKLILNMETGIYYTSISKAAFSANIRQGTLSKWLNGKGNNITSFIQI